MTTSPEAPELIQYSCERCKTRFVLPPSSRKLGLTGMFRAFSTGVGRALKMHEGLRHGVGVARRELLAKMDDEAYQAFVVSFRFCHECRQFVCNDCWSKARGTCLTCATKAMPSPARTSPAAAPARPVLTPARPVVKSPIPDIPRPIISAAPQRRGRTRRDFVLVGMTLAIVLLSIEGGVLLLNATGGPSDLSAGQSQNGSQAPGSNPSPLRQWIVTPPPETPGGGTASSSSNPNGTGTTGSTGSTGSTGTLAPGATERPGATHGPTKTLRPGETPPPATPTPPGQTPTPPGQTPTPTPIPTPPPTDTPTPSPGQVIITASSGTMTYGGSVPAITPSYAGLTGGDTAPTNPPTCSTVATSSSTVGPYTSSCTGASDPKYTFTYVDGSVTVDPAPVTVTASSPSITYGDAVPTITAGYSPSIVPATLPSCSTTYNQGDAAGGSYATSCSGAADPNYTFTPVGGTVSVAKRTLHATCDSYLIAVGADVPPYGFTITSGSFYGSETWGSLPTCSSSYQTTDPAEVIQITISPGTVSSNYSATYSDGTLTVQ
jgi:hypothetical protein